MAWCLDFGVLSLSIVALTLLFTGMVLSVQIAGELTKYGAGFTVGAIVASEWGANWGRCFAELFWRGAWVLLLRQKLGRCA